MRERVKRDNMAEKELRRLKRRELLQMLLVQCEETERLSQETDAMKEEMGAVMESYERLKKKLDIKDERLNQKDKIITELKREIEEMKTAKEEGTEEIGSAADAARRLGEIFEEAQKAVEQYMIHVKTHSAKKSPFETERAAGARKRQLTSRNGQVVPIGLSKAGAGSARGTGTEMTVTAAASGDIYG